MRRIIALLAVLAATVAAVLVTPGVAKAYQCCYPHHYDVYSYCQAWEWNKLAQNVHGDWFTCQPTNLTRTGFGWIPLSEMG